MANYKIYIDTFELISTTNPTKPFDRVPDEDVFMTYRLGRVGDLENREKALPLIAYESDDPEEARRFLDMGIDCILSNDYNRVANAVNAWMKEHEGG